MPGPQAECASLRYVLVHFVSEKVKKTLSVCTTDERKNRQLTLHHKSAVLSESREMEEEEVNSTWFLEWLDHFGT